MPPTAAVLNPGCTLNSRMEAFKITHACAHPNPLESAGGGTKRKLLCLMHSEAKQTETEFRAEKGLLQGHARRTGGSCPKSPQLLKGFRQSTFKGQVSGEGHGVCDQLVHNSLIG